MVRLEHVGKRYPSSGQVLSDISLSLEPGAFCFLTGASGAGKSTLLKIMTLAEPPSRGKLTLFGRDAAGLDRPAKAALRRRIGVVFQDLRLLDELSARDNVALPLRIAGAPAKQIRNNVAELLAWVGLAGRGELAAAALSGSERQRVAIARAIVARPELLVADEPTGHVEDEMAGLLVDIFERINRLGTIVVIATHDVGFARRYEHRRYHLEQGVLAAAGPALPQ